MKMRFILILAASLTAAAQTPSTGVRLAQLAAPATSGPAVLMVVAVGGLPAYIPVQLDASIQYDPATNTLKAVAAAPAQQQVWGEATATTAPTPTIALARDPIQGSVRVYRNGIRLAPTIDYTVSGRNITFVPEQIPGPGEVVVCDYSFR